MPFYEEHGIPVQRVLADRGTECCGTHDRHEYELYLAGEDIDRTWTKARSPQTNASSSEGPPKPNPRHGSQVERRERTGA